MPSLQKNSFLLCITLWSGLQLTVGSCASDCFSVLTITLMGNYINGTCYYEYRILNAEIVRHKNDN